MVRLFATRQETPQFCFLTSLLPPLPHKEHHGQNQWNCDDDPDGRTQRNGAGFRRFASFGIGGKGGIRLSELSEGLFVPAIWELPTLRQTAIQNSIKFMSVGIPILKILISMWEPIHNQRLFVYR